MTAEQVQADAMRAATIKAGPDDDICALAWADTLIQAGDDDRAEFVKACVALRSGEIVTRADAVLARRQIDLLLAHEHEWRRAGACRTCGGRGRRLAGGHHYGDREYEPCKKCDGTGDAGGLLRRLRPYHPDYGHAGPEQWAHPVRWRRGLPDAVECTLTEVLERCCGLCKGSGKYGHPPAPSRGMSQCPRCQGSGNPAAQYENAHRPTAWARAVATHHPSVTRFVLTDREPRSFGAGEWQWLRGSLGDQFGAWELPEPVFDGLSRDPDRAVYAFQQPRRRYPTREAALDEMVVAAMKVVRG
jgi:uncharacterized protein (TIGR02996 family)